jgi:hypothetical protein
MLDDLDRPPGEVELIESARAIAKHLTTARSVVDVLKGAYDRLFFHLVLPGERGAWGRLYAVIESGWDDPEILGDAIAQVRAVAERAIVNSEHLSGRPGNVATELMGGLMYLGLAWHALRQRAAELQASQPEAAATTTGAGGDAPPAATAFGDGAVTEGPGVRGAA